MNVNSNLPPRLLCCLNLLIKSGFEAYAVGGMVRDIILNRNCDDFDVTTNALPHQIIQVFSRYKTVQTNTQHGTIIVVFGHTPIEITTYRIDGEYLDNRRPSSVKFTDDLYEDLCRRDFTMNALTLNINGEIEDVFDGKADIQNKIIRVIGDGEKRFSEDALRIMRAFRFMAQLDFTIEMKTQTAIKSTANLLLNISKERITAELSKLLCSDTPIQSLELMVKLGVLKYILPHSKLPEKFGDSRNLALQLAIIIDGINEISHLRFDKTTIDLVEILLKYKYTNFSDDPIFIKRLLSEIGSENVEILLNFKQDLGLDTEHFRTVFCDIIKNNECYSLSQLNINGNDLIKIGILGKNIGLTLHNLLEIVIKDNSENTSETLHLLATNSISL